MTLHRVSPRRSSRLLATLGAALVALACGKGADSGGSQASAPASAERTPTKAAPPALAAVAPATARAALPDAAPAKERATSVNTAGDLLVRRFVVAGSVENREPAMASELSTDTPQVYAFAELVNRSAEVKRVRVTFERKGSNARVGHAVLEIPAGATRYRTWGTSRYVREAGTWEAVLWAENGAELGRAEFEVSPGRTHEAGT